MQGRGGVSFTRTGRRTSFTFFADRSSSAGGSLMGTSTDTTATVTVSNLRTIRWSWSVAARYVLRQPTRSDMSNVETISGEFAFGRRIGKSLEARLTARVFRQFSESTAFVGSAPEGAVRLVWSPRGQPAEAPFGPIRGI